MVNAIFNPAGKLEHVLNFAWTCLEHFPESCSQRFLEAIKNQVNLSLYCSSGRVTLIQVVGPVLLHTEVNACATTAPYNSFPVSIWILYCSHSSNRQEVESEKKAKLLEEGSPLW